MNNNCKHLKCSLGRADILCTATCFMRREMATGAEKVAYECSECKALKDEIVALHGKINSLTMGKSEPIKEEDAAEETPKRKYNKRK